MILMKHNSISKPGWLTNDVRDAADKYVAMSYRAVSKWDVKEVQAAVAPMRVSVH